VQHWQSRRCESGARERRKGRAQTLPSPVAAFSNDANRSGNSREELNATIIEVVVRMKGLTMLRTQPHPPYSIGVTAEAK
jgi:hypothetical protein